MLYHVKVRVTTDAPLVLVAVLVGVHLVKMVAPMGVVTAATSTVIWTVILVVLGHR